MNQELMENLNTVGPLYKNLEGTEEFSSYNEDVFILKLLPYCLIKGKIIWNHSNLVLICGMFLYRGVLL